MPAELGQRGAIYWEGGLEREGGTDQGGHSHGWGCPGQGEKFGYGCKAASKPPSPGCAALIWELWSAWTCVHVPAKQQVQI